jgi:hypothetical protein
VIPWAGWFFVPCEWPCGCVCGGEQWAFGVWRSCRGRFLVGGGSGGRRYAVWCDRGETLGGPTRGVPAW